MPTEKPARYALAAQIGADDRQLLLAVYASTAPAWLRELPAVQILRRVWLQQFAATNDDQPLQWRTAEEVKTRLMHLLLAAGWQPGSPRGLGRARDSQPLPRLPEHPLNSGPLSKGSPAAS